MMFATSPSMLQVAEVLRPSAYGTGQRRPSDGGRRLEGLMRTLRARPNGVATILDVLRAAEVHGAVETAALAQVVHDVPLQLALACQASEDARHCLAIL